MEECGLIYKPLQNEKVYDISRINGFQRRKVRVELKSVFPPEILALEKLVINSKGAAEIRVRLELGVLRYWLWDLEDFLSLCRSQL